MAAGSDVSVDCAAPTDAATLANLLELYSHELSEIFALELGADGRLGYDQLRRYWSGPEGRFAFLIRCATQLVGFALVTRGSPASNDPDDFDVAESTARGTYVQLPQQTQLRL